MVVPDPRTILARRLLEDVVSELERLAAGGAYHTLLLPQLGAAAVFLPAPDVTRRIEALLATAPEESFMAGISSTLSRPEELPVVWRSLPALVVLERRHPPYDRAALELFVRTLAHTEPHLALYLEGDAGAALAAACDQPNPGLALESLAETQAFLGDFTGARDTIARHVSPPYRQQIARLVLAIELFRAGQVMGARVVLSELEAIGLDLWERTQLILGLAGREPWGGYPYADW